MWQKILTQMSPELSVSTVFTARPRRFNKQQWGPVGLRGDSQTDSMALVVVWDKRHTTIYRRRCFYYSEQLRLTEMRSSGAPFTFVKAKALKVLDRPLSDSVNEGVWKSTTRLSKCFEHLTSHYGSCQATDNALITCSLVLFRQTYNWDKDYPVLSDNLDNSTLFIYLQRKI